MAGQHICVGAKPRWRERWDWSGQEHLAQTRFTGSGSLLWERGRKYRMCSNTGLGQGTEAFKVQLQEVELHPIDSVWPLKGVAWGHTSKDLGSEPVCSMKDLSRTKKGGWASWKKTKEKERGGHSGQGSEGVSCRDSGTVSYIRDTQNRRADLEIVTSELGGKNSWKDLLNMLMKDAG